MIVPNNMTHMPFNVLRASLSKVVSLRLDDLDL
jgi:hypothetical protein